MGFQIGINFDTLDALNNVTVNSLLVVVHCVEVNEDRPLIQSDLWPNGLCHCQRHRLTFSVISAIFVSKYV